VRRTKTEQPARYRRELHTFWAHERPENLA